VSILGLGENKKQPFNNKISSVKCMIRFIGAIPCINESIEYQEINLRENNVLYENDKSSL
jgi:hypothetical protein